EMLRNDLATRLGELRLPSGVSVEVSLRRTALPFSVENLDHQPLVGDGTQHVMLSGQVAAPAAVHDEVAFQVLVAKTAASSRTAFKIVLSKGDLMDVRLSDLHPTFSAAFRLRLNSWLKRQLSELLRTLERESSFSLKAQGYG